MGTSKLSLCNCEFIPWTQTVSDHRDILLQLCVRVCVCLDISQTGIPAKEGRIVSVAPILKER